MKNYKLIWGGKLNTKILRMDEMEDDMDEPSTETYVAPPGNTQSYPINQVLVTPGNLTTWGSLTINWINSPTQQQTQEVDSLTDWMNEQQNSDFI